MPYFIEASPRPRRGTKVRWTRVLDQSAYTFREPAEEHASYLRFRNGSDTMYQVRKANDFEGTLLLSFRAQVPLMNEPEPAPATPTRKVRFHAS
jgi:hypothetical protein